MTLENIHEGWHAHAPKLVGGAIGDRTAQGRGAVERPIVMNDDDAVARQVNVELDSVGSERQAVVERFHRVFRRKRAAAAVREHQRASGAEERMTHDASLQRGLNVREPLGIVAIADNGFAARMSIAWRGTSARRTRHQPVVEHDRLQPVVPCY